MTGSFPHDMARGERATAGSGAVYGAGGPVTRAYCDGVWPIFAGFRHGARAGAIRPESRAAIAASGRAAGPPAARPARVTPTSPARPGELQCVAREDLAGLGPIDVALEVESHAFEHLLRGDVVGVRDGEQLREPEAFARELQNDGRGLARVALAAMALEEREPEIRMLEGVATDEPAHPERL